MKKLLLLLVLVANVATAQTTDTLSGFLGLSFGSTKEQVREFISKNGGTISSEKPNTIYAINLKQVLTPCKVTITMFKFTSDNKMVSGSMLVEPSSDPLIFDAYDGIVSKLSSKYGEGDEAVDAKYPYSKEDKRRLSAITAGYVAVETMWNLNDSDPNNTEKNTITVRITNNPKVFIRIENTKLYKQFDKEEKEAEKNSY
jgi:hypothetical protein